MGIDRRTFLRGAGGGAVLGGAALLAGCTQTNKLVGHGKSGSEKSYLTKADAGVGKGTPVRGGQLIIATGSEVNGVDPASSSWDTTGLTYAGTVYDTLMALAPDGSVHPYLAQSVTPNPDYDVWTIQLRPNIVFHNGTALDAAAVKENLDAFVASELTGAAFNNVDTTTVSGPLTVTVTTKTPWVAFPYYLTAQVGNIAEPSTLASSAVNHPIGTGPFVFSDWVPNSHFVATRNPNYWRKGLPYLDQVTYTPIVDPGAREDALKSGSANLIQTNFTQNLVDFWDLPGYTVINDLGYKFEPAMDCIMLNTAVAPLDDLRVRQALAYAANPEEIVQYIWNGIPPVATGPYLPGSPYYAPTGFPSYNLAKAKQLVKEVEAEKGPISFNFDTLPSTQYVRINELVQGMWQKAGIQCTIQEIQQATLIQNAITGKYQATAWSQFNTPDPDGNYVWWSSKSVQPIGGLSLNMARNTDAMLQAALQTGRESTDQQTRVEAYQTVARRLAADLPYLWSNPAVWTIAAQNKVQNFNGGTLPAGGRRLAMLSGVLWPTEMWIES